MTGKSTGNSTGSGKRKGVQNLIPWKPGQSGNPNGRKLGVRNRRTVIIDAIRRIAKAKDISAEEVEDAIQAVGIEKAMRGSYFHYQEISNGLYGKVTDKVDLKSGGKTLTDLIAKKLGGTRSASKPDSD